MRFSLYSELQLHPGKTAEQLYGEVLEQIDDGTKVIGLRIDRHALRAGRA